MSEPRVEMVTSADLHERLGTLHAARADWWRLQRLYGSLDDLDREIDAAEWLLGGSA